VVIKNNNLVEQQHVCMLIDKVEDKKDIWLIYQLCQGQTLNELLFDVKGEFFKGERIYKVNHQPFYTAIRKNLNLLRDLLARMADALSLFARLSIVHADLKPDNIIIDYDAQSQTIIGLKIIDLGSSFLLNPEGHVAVN
jgi:serine/threonine protein kinase